MMWSALPKSVAEFRENYRANEIPPYSSEVVPFLFTSVSSLACSIKALFTGLVPNQPAASAAGKDS